MMRKKVSTYAAILKLPHELYVNDSNPITPSIYWWLGGEAAVKDIKRVLLLPTLGSAA